MAYLQSITMLLSGSAPLAALPHIMPERRRPGRSRKDAGFIVKEGQKLAYVYYEEDEPGRRSTPKLLT
jgi:hypothetical protein